MVDATAQVIIAADVTQAPNDKQQAQPLLQQAIANTGQVPKTASLDAGYYSENNVHALTAGAGPGRFRGALVPRAQVRRGAARC